ncbi:MAG TPA: GNAT family N-acetyltransferase [Candidatus Latescibacteria bacterium]|nr:hypothetical protein [Gemmatimonadaceae bacterium]MDP6019031.1 GNAT family N-acetyltransferase [Candidatus Latescibacterota bacterium]HJP34033.1 GNAT family N-acetyltransferase [Candidatus Latescibacterota bacterium]
MAPAERFRIDIVAPDVWNRFLETADGATIFSHAEWMATAAQASGAESRLLGAWDGDHLVAGVAGVSTGSGWRRRFSTPDLSPHTGFLFRPSTTDRPAHIESERSGATGALLEHLQANNARIHLTHSPSLVDAREFVWAGWQVQPRYTYQIELPEDRTPVWDGFERRTRTAVRKAEKAGFRVEASNDAVELRRLYGQVYGGEERAPVAGNIVEKMVELALETGRAEGWRCQAPSGATAAVVFFVPDGDTLYAWVAGADPAQRDSGATSLLYWKVMESSPCSRFDFVGANLAAIAFFKRGFGGLLVPYFATEGFGHPLLRTAVGLRRAIRRLS